MAPPRPYWKRLISNFPWFLARSRFTRRRRQASESPSGKQSLRQQLIDEGTGEPIDPDDKGRGYEVDKGVYLRVED
jgi:hypothetical protein